MTKLFNRFSYLFVALATAIIFNACQSENVEPTLESQPDLDESLTALERARQQAYQDSFGTEIANQDNNTYEGVTARSELRVHVSDGTPNGQVYRPTTSFKREGVDLTYYRGSPLPAAGWKTKSVSRYIYLTYYDLSLSSIVTTQQSPQILFNFGFSQKTKCLFEIERWNGRKYVKIYDSGVIEDDRIYRREFVEQGWFRVTCWAKMYGKWEYLKYVVRIAP